MSMAIMTSLYRVLVGIGEAIHETRLLQAEARRRYPGLMSAE